MRHRMHSKFRTPVFLLLLLVAFALPAAAQTSITMWLYHSQGVEDWADQFQADFNEANPDIKLDLQLVPFSDLREKVLVVSASGVGPDIAYFPSNLMVEWITQGVSRPIDQYVERMPDRDDFLPDVLAPLRDEKGRLHALPYGMWPIFDLYNADIFNKNGISMPEDWDELLTATRKNTKLANDGSVEVYGYTNAANWAMAIYDLHMYMEQLGKGLLYLGDDKVSLNNDRARRALSFMKELWTTGMPNFESGAHSYDNIVSGHSAVMSAATYPAMTLDVGSTQLDPRVVVGPEPGQGIVRHNAGNIYMLATTKHPDEAWRVMEAFLKPKNLRGFYKTYGQWLPVRKSMFKEIQDLYPYPMAPKLVDLFSKPLYTYGARHGFWGKVRKPGGDILVQAAKGEMGISSALEESERLMNSILSDELAKAKK